MSPLTWCFWRPVLAGIGLAGSLVFLPAHAQTAQPTSEQAPIVDTLILKVSATEEYDDNLFRLPDGVPATAVPGESARSDLISIDSVGLKFDKTYSLQRFTIDATLVNYNYRTYSYLNFLGKNADASWRWSITPELTGDIVVSRSQSINSFSDFTGITARNINTTDNRRVDADYRITGGWHVQAAAFQLVQSNDVPVFELENVRINSFELSGRYESEAGNSVALYARTANGFYLNQPLDPIAQIDDSFVEHEEGVRVVYQVDGSSSLYAQLGYLSRSNEHFSSRDFGGPVAQLSYSIDVTGKIKLFTTVQRTLSSYQQATSSYVVNNSLGVGPTWAITEKTSVSLRYQEYQYQFRGALVNAGPLRDDISHRVTLNGTWNAFRNFNVIGAFTHQNRQSNQSGLQYVDNISSIQATYAF